jgi:methylated-DNA-[protein]-cysteine S-methyltransferase
LEEDQMTARELSIEGGRKGLTSIAFDGGTTQASDGTHEGLDLAQKGATQLHEYLVGDRSRFDLPIDLESIPGLTPYRRSVLEALLRIPSGETVSYGELAAVVGSRSARAVGQAVGWNPLPILIPCHRVIAADGGLGGYSGGLDRKELLLAVEGIRIES